MEDGFEADEKAVPRSSDQPAVSSAGAPGIPGMALAGLNSAAWGTGLARTAVQSANTIKVAKRRNMLRLRSSGDVNFSECGSSFSRVRSTHLVPCMLIRGKMRNVVARRKRKGESEEEDFATSVRFKLINHSRQPEQDNTGLGAPGPSDPPRILRSGL